MSSWQYHHGRRWWSWTLMPSSWKHIQQCSLTHIVWVVEFMALALRLKSFALALISRISVMSAFVGLTADLTARHPSTAGSSRWLYYRTRYEMDALHEVTLCTMRLKCKCECTWRLICARRKRCSYRVRASKWHSAMCDGRTSQVQYSLNITSVLL